MLFRSRRQLLQRTQHDVYITKLRKHLKDDPNVEINNVHGKGYRLVVPYN